MNELLAVDVGTGTIVGFLGRKVDGKLEILAREQAEYPRRAIEEGRVVDMEEAANCLKKVVTKLQQEAKTSVNVAHFAVPGRGIEIEEFEAELEFNEPRKVIAEDVEKLFKQRRQSSVEGAIVDESVIERKIDGEEVLDFEGQFGRKMEARWLITSLDPDEVENKKIVIEKSGLIPGQLVLEPRAAVEAAFPSHEFKPRLGLIDFGAGTIDAALLEDGQIRDFCTLLGSGDRLTRCLEDMLLVDFNDAEKIKRQLHAESEVNYKNLGGETCTITRSEMIERLNPVITKEMKPLKKWFAKREPRVLFLAGGGSKYPNLPRLVSRSLDIPRTDVVSRLPRLKPGVEDPDNLVQSPLDYTAYGILLLAADREGRYSLTLTVNGDRMRRLVSPGEYRAEDLAADMGYVAREAHPESTMMVCVDGEWITEQKKQRLQPLVKINGEQVSLDTKLRSGDNVELLPAEEPEPINIQAGDFLPEGRLHVLFNDQLFRLLPRLKSEDGKWLKADDDLADGSEYRRKLAYTRMEIRTVLENKGVELPERLLWKQGGKYTHKEQFEIGEEVKLQSAINPSLRGLSSLEELPPEPEKPLNQPLN